MRIAHYCLPIAGLFLSGCMLPRPIDPIAYTVDCSESPKPQFRGTLFATARLPDCRKGLLRMSWHREQRDRDWQGVWATHGQQLLSSDAWTTALNEQIAATEPGTATILYIHGFNNGNDEALERAAAIRIATGGRRAVVAFTWPSYGSTRKYFWDEVNAEWTTAKALALLERLTGNGRKVIIVAHSMGNRVALDLVRAWPLRHNGQPLPVEQLIMASPDVDRAWFARQASLGLKLPITLYGSTYDQPLSASWRSHGYPRAGDLSLWVKGNDFDPALPQSIPPSVTVVDTSPVATGMFKHADFIESDEGAADLCRVITAASPGSGRTLLVSPNFHVLIKGHSPSDDPCVKNGRAAAATLRK